MTAPDDLSRTRDGYDVVAEEYARLLPTLDAETPLDVAMIDDFADRCASAGAGLVIDAGCGTGRVSAHLAERGLPVIGIDLSPGMVATARRLHPDLRFELGALENLPVPDAAAGGLLAWYSLIHTAPERLPHVVGEMRRVLAPGAWLLTAFQVGAGERVVRTSAYGHAVAMTSYRHDPDHVATVLAEAGLAPQARLHRAAHGQETTAQAVLLARR